LPPPVVGVSHCHSGSQWSCDLLALSTVGVKRETEGKQLSLADEIILEKDDNSTSSNRTKWSCKTSGVLFI